MNNDRFRLLVNPPGGPQELIEVGIGGGYFDLACVVWDERTDGPLPEISLGGMKRVGNALVLDQAMLDAANTAANQAMVAKLKAEATARIQTLLDSTAQAHGYDDLERAISYIGDAVPHWDAEGVRAKAWRSACWSKAKQIQDDATAGNWPTAGAGQVPTVDDVLAAMPPANWPAAA